MVLGFLVFALLSAAVVFAAVAVGVRIRWHDRAELFVGAFVIGHALIVFPTLALGWTNLLYRPVLGLAVAAISAICIVLSGRGVPMRDHLSATWRALLGLGRMPYDAIVAAARTRHVALVGLVATAMALTYTSWLAYMAPSTGWDAIWYHETIVGYSIQNHGFRFLELPAKLDYINTFPRVCEMMNLWFVVFTDRRFIDMVNDAMCPALVVSFYVMARRYEPSPLRAVAWATALFWLPGVFLQLNSSYIDTHIGAIHLATLAIATRPKLRLRDGLVAGLAFGLLAGTKGHALTWIPFSGTVAFARLFWQNFRAKKAATLGVAAFGLGSVVFVAAPTYVRNWQHYQNPLYPIDVVSNDFKFHWVGHIRIEDITRPFWQVVGDLYNVYVPGKDFVDIGTYGYGFAIPWVAIPLAVVALPFAFGATVRGWVRAVPSATTDNLLLTTLPVLVTAPFSPALWSARYNIHVAAGLLLLAAWATSKRGLNLFGDGPVATCLGTSLAFLYWAVPGWGVTLNQGLAMSRLSSLERAAFEWHEGWTLHDFAMNREQLQPHDVVAYTEANFFPSILWNERYQNDIVYVPWTGSAEFLHALDDIHAKWATTFQNSVGYQELATSPQWQDMGDITRNGEHWRWFKRR